MADQDDVRRIALSLPQTEEAKDRFAFLVRNKDKLRAFVCVWVERLEPKKARVPRPDVIAVSVSNLVEKDITPIDGHDEVLHRAALQGFSGVLVQLPAVDAAQLEELITDAWRCQAPPALVRQVDH